MEEGNFKVTIKYSDLSLEERKKLMQKWIARILFNKKPIEELGHPGDQIAKPTCKKYQR